MYLTLNIFFSEIKALEKQLMKEEIKLRKMKKKLEKTFKRFVYEKLKNIFTPRQIEKFIKQNKRRLLRRSENVPSISSLSGLNQKTYRYLEKNTAPLSILRKRPAQMKKRRNY